LYVDARQIKTNKKKTNILYTYLLDATLILYLCFLLKKLKNKLGEGKLWLVYFSWLYRMCYAVTSINRTTEKMFLTVNLTQ